MKTAFILICGLSGSGKTHLGKRLSQELNIDRSDTDEFEDFLKPRYSLVRNDDFPYKKSSLLRQELVNNFHIDLVGTYLRNNQSIILEKVGAVRSKRQRAIEFAKGIDQNIQTILIFVNTNESEILERLKMRDEQRTDEPRWVPLYTDGQKIVLELPDSDEADHVFIVSDTKNNNEVEEMIIKIRSVL